MPKADQTHMKRDCVQRSHFDLLHHFYIQHHREVMAYAMFFTRNEDDATDTLQDTFCKALDSLKKGTEVDNPRAWLMKIARNSMLRRRDRSRLENASWQKLAEVTPLHSNFTPRVLDQVLAESISEFVNTECTKDEQEIFVLRHFHEMNLSDIAELTNQPLTNIHRVLAGITSRVESKFSSLLG